MVFSIKLHAVVLGSLVSKASPMGGSRMNQPKQPSEQRRYPPFWERAVPVIVALISIVVLGLAVVAISVALGVFPAGS